MKKHLSTILLVLILLAGLSLMLYPTVADWWNSMHQSRAVATYQETVSTLDTGVYDKARVQAKAYNDALAEKPYQFVMSEEELALYESLLDLGGNGIMGVVEVPGIGCRMPVYHGTDEGVLQIAIGHIEGTSLPVGGEGTHCALSGHRGLPSARLFTDLDQMTIGDRFMIHVLDETLTYEVDRIETVLPEDTSMLMIEPGRDYCTLVTCTPYGINSHRLLVRGRRVAYEETRAPVVIRADAAIMEPRKVGAILGAPLLLIVLPAALLPKGQTQRRKKKKA